MMVHALFLQHSNFVPDNFQTFHNILECSGVFRILDPRIIRYNIKNYVKLRELVDNQSFRPNYIICSDTILNAETVRPCSQMAYRDHLTSIQDMQAEVQLWPVSATWKTWNSKQIS